MPSNLRDSQDTANFLKTSETKDGMYLNSLRFSNQNSEQRDSKYIDKSSEFNLSG